VFFLPFFLSLFHLELDVTPVQVAKPKPVEMAVIEVPPPPVEPPEPPPDVEPAPRADGAAPSAKRASERAAARRKAAARIARNAGILGALSSQSDSQMASIFGSGGLSSGLDDSAVTSGLIGNEVGEAYGAGGLGLAGTGRGGGGTGEGTIGLGSLGTIGHGGGSGGGSGYGRGSGRLGRGPRVRSGRVTANGLDAAIARRVLRRALPRVRACAGEAAGRLGVRLRIDERGGVTSATVTRSLSSSVDACVVRAVERLRFPSPKSKSASIETSWRFSG
jgi:hypothetical protein